MEEKEDEVLWLEELITRVRKYKSVGEIWNCLTALGYDVPQVEQDFDVGVNKWKNESDTD